MTEDFLVFEGVTKRFGGFTAVDRVGFSVRQGEVFSLLGPSGCGKTTLLKMVAGFERPDEGRVLLEGRDMADLPPDRRPVNTVFQSYALFPHMTLRENIGFGLRMARRAAREIESEVGKMLELVDLTAHGDKKPAEISGGQRQRVAIARALINKPRVLLLDEPLAALDLKLRQRLLVELDGIHDEVGITFLYVTHDQGEAMGISDRIAVMNQGRVEQIGTPGEIYEAPVSSFVAAFIGDTNFLGGIVREQVGEEYSLVEVSDLGTVVIYNDRKLSPGDLVHLSIRPEKFRLRSAPPDARSISENAIEAIVEDVVYLGSQTRYWVRAGRHRISVERQHTRFLLDEKPPQWGDRVWLCWFGDDGYLLGDFKPEHAAMLSMPPEHAAGAPVPMNLAGTD